jgi:hypothetical protein
MTMNLATPSPSDLRDELTAMVVRDLLGPAGGPEEELDQYEDHVFSRYLVGMLARTGSEIAGGELDELAVTDGDEGEESAPESGVPAGNTYFPFSMGLSFVVGAETTAIVVEAQWGHYLKIKSATQHKKDGAPANVWKRTPVVAPALTLPLQVGHLAPMPLHPEHPQVALQGCMRLTAGLGGDPVHGQSAGRAQAPQRAEG